MCILDICKICNYLYAMFYMYIDNVSFLEHYKLTCLFTLAIWLHTIMYIISKNDQWNFTFKLISTSWENMSPIIWSYLLYVLWNQCHCECCIVYLLLWIITFYILRYLTSPLVLCAIRSIYLCLCDFFTIDRWQSDIRWVALRPGDPCRVQNSRGTLLQPRQTQPR